MIPLDLQWAWWRVKNWCQWHGATAWWTLRTIRRPKERVMLICPADAALFSPGQLVCWSGQPAMRVVRVTGDGVLVCAKDGP